MERSPREIQLAHKLLEQLCYRQQVLSSVDKRVRFHPGDSLQTNREPLIKGHYGLVYLLSEKQELPIAQCGFDLIEDSFVITNSPQGVTREKLDNYTLPIVSEVFSELRKGGFRNDLLKGVIEIGKKFKAVGVTKITGIAAEHHDKVDINGGPLPLSVAKKSMNYLYEKHGFYKTEEGDYWLQL